MRLRTAVLSRRQGRLFCWLISVILIASLAHAVPVCTVSDIVYRGDGTPAQGTLVISWPAFTSAENKAVAAGSMSVAIGSGGAVTLALVPNEGGDPANTYYKVVYKLNEAVASRDIADEAKFRDGLGKIIDGVVQCLNASTWAKAR
jgi:hypothetical protein